MELQPLIDALSDPAAYPEPVDRVEVRQTHISAVFLAGHHVYKVKKPVNLGFLDFSTLERRRHFCAEEVRLNRRLAGPVYQGVVPVTRSGPRLTFEGQGEPVEWAVKMERLPAEATLSSVLRHGDVTPEQVEALARRLASFHAAAEAGPAVTACATFEAVARNARDNFTQSAGQVGDTIRPAVLDRLRRLTEEALARLHPLIDSRAARGVPRDTHGDLHLDHVYLFPGRPPPRDLVIIDCIEFDERFRYADPVADMAFLVMDLVGHGRRDLARAFADAYFQAADDQEGRALLPFYTAYRAAVRAKVEGLQLAEKEVSEADRGRARAGARAHWLLALGELEEPGRRPALVLVGGLPGTGKSTLARNLAEHADLTVIRSDVVRKELAGAGPSSAGQGGLYSPARTEHTYRECLRRAEERLFAGRRVLVDATFREERWRRDFLDAAAGWSVPSVLLLCEASSETARARLAGRQGDASDADWAVRQQLADQWEEPGPLTRPRLRAVATEGSPGQPLAQGLSALRDLGLVGPR
jgi:aminoglycoside phosphotransferase family enzyme/predicted kinase